MVREMSVWGNVLVGKCSSRKCPVGDLSVRENFHRGSVHWGSVSQGFVPRGSVSQGSCPVRKLSYNLKERLNKSASCFEISILEEIIFYKVYYLGQRPY